MAIDVRVRDKDPLAQFLGWFSIGLGSAQLGAPRMMCRIVGASVEGLAPGVMRLTGARELVQGTGILVRPRPRMWLWSRVAGDALDLSLLALVAVKNRRARTAIAIANVVAVMVPDVYESLFLTRKKGEVRSGVSIRKAVTINRPPHEVDQAWNAAFELRCKAEDEGARVVFAEAPGNRGTEVIVEFEYKPRAGDLGAAVEKLRGSDLATQLSDDLRRFKQQVETSEIVRSESTPDGHLLADHLRQRSAQPLEEGVR